MNHKRAKKILFEYLSRTLKVKENLILNHIFQSAKYL